MLRYANPANPLAYKLAIESLVSSPLPAALDEPELLFEFMLNALRLSGGFDEALFEERTGLPAGRLADAAKPALERGLIDRKEAGHWRATALGRRFLNDLQAEFLPD